jgi:uncharacterized protein YndB with AHSA1/START domain
MATITMEQEKENAGLKLEFTRVIKASREKVYAAWSQPEVLQTWFGPEHMTKMDVELNAKVGGEYLIRVQGVRPATADKGKEEPFDAYIRGAYRKVVPNELLQFTWRADWDPGVESLVTVKLRDVEGGTELTLNHEQFATEFARDGHQMGWTGALVKLVKVLEA